MSPPPSICSMCGQVACHLVDSLAVSPHLSSRPWARIVVNEHPKAGCTCLCVVIAGKPVPGWPYPRLAQCSRNSQAWVSAGCAPVEVGVGACRDGGCRGCRAFVSFESSAGVCYTFISFDTSVFGSRPRVVRQAGVGRWLIVPPCRSTWWCSVIHALVSFDMVAFGSPRRRVVRHAGVGRLVLLSQ